MDVAPQVAVHGEAVLEVEPEIAEIGVTVRVTARNRETALERCQARHEEVLAVIRAAGDDVERAETTHVAVYLDHRPRGGPGDPVASVHTRLTIGRLDAVGDLVVALARLEDVEVSGPSWELRPDSPVYERARIAAVSDALRRARSYARAFGAELTALLEVTDPGVTPGGLRFAAAADSMGSFGERETHLDLTPARREVHGRVEVRFAMTVPEQEVFRG